MSRFADRGDQVEVDLGPCQCPGSPHAKDTALIRRKFSDSASLRIAAAGNRLGIDPLAQMRQVVVEGTLRWNLLGPDGKPTVPAPGSIDELDSETISAIASAISEEWSKASLPNDSAGDSANGSSGTPSPTPETPAPASSTTSS